MKWSEEELSILESLIKRKISNERIIELLTASSNRTKESVRKKINKIRRNKEFSRSIILPPEIVYNNKFINYEEKPPVYEWLDNLRDFAIELGPIEYKQPQIKGDKTLVIVLSDLHFGKITEEFNAKVCEERLLSIPFSLGEINFDRIRDVHVCLVGDIVDGEEIYPTHSHHVQFGALDQITFGTEVLWNFLCVLEKITQRPVTVDMVPGNHGRVSKTVSEKTNWDNVLYYTLSLIAAASKNNIVVRPNYKPFHTIDIQDKKVLLVHESVKHLGTPATRIKVAGWSIDKNIDIIVSGHWHSWLFSQWMDKVLIINGSLPGSDDLGERMALNNKPAQVAFVVERDKPIDWFKVLYVGDNE